MSICSEKRKTRDFGLGLERVEVGSQEKWSQDPDLGKLRLCPMLMPVVPGWKNISIHVTPYTPCTRSFMFLGSNKYIADVE